MARSRTLLIGAGSGRDIASAILALDEGDAADGVDLAGFLTPWAWHRFDEQMERPLNQLGRRARKFFADRPDGELTSFFEPHLPLLLERVGLRIGDLFLFSLQFGTRALEAAVRELVERAGYDRIVVVDVGGDILAGQEQFGTVLTPLVDFSCLDIIAGLTDGIALELVVVAPGVCGEMPSAALTSILTRLQLNGAVLSTSGFSAAGPAYHRFVAVNLEIERLTTARSHTFEVVTDIAVRAASASPYVKEYAKTYVLGDRSFSCRFPISIDAGLHNQIWRLDLRRARNAVSRPSASFATVGEGVAIAKAAGLCGTEVDCSAIAIRPHDRGPVPAAYVLTPCCHATGPSREQILRAGMEVMAASARPVVVLRSDASLLRDFDVEWHDAGAALLVAAGPDARDLAAATVALLAGRDAGPMADGSSPECSG